MIQISKHLRTTIFLCIPLSIFLFDCTTHHSPLEKLNWLNGRWENENNGLKTVETWTRSTNDIIKVNGFMLEETDTIFSESIKVSFSRGKVIYAATVPDQNNGQAVAFEGTEITEQKAVFENPEHDFPQLIAYTKAGPDSLLVLISGNMKGKAKTEKYYLRRSKK